MEIKEQVAHLKGLIEGMEYDMTTKEGKIFAAVMDILENMADEIDGINEDVETLYDYADELDEDLGDVESELYGEFCDDEDYEDFDDEDECECDGTCAGCSEESDK